MLFSCCVSIYFNESFVNHALISDNTQDIVTVNKIGHIQPFFCIILRVCVNDCSRQGNDAYTLNVFYITVYIQRVTHRIRINIEIICLNSIDASGICHIQQFWLCVCAHIILSIRNRFLYCKFISSNILVCLE